MSGSSPVEVGSVADMVSRIRTVMPASWFPLTAPDATVSVTPVLDGLLNGIGQAWSFCYALTMFVRQQTRIATASGGFLDMICADLFGNVIRRNAGEADAAFRSRIQANLLLPRATRGALSQTISTLLGEAPLIVEPSRAADTGGNAGRSSPGVGGGGGYGSPGLTLGSATMPFQFLVAVAGVMGRTSRESEASYIDADNLMQIASRHAVRPLFAGGVVAGPLIETRGFNLIKDSLGWSGWSLPTAQQPVTWSVDAAGDGALLAAQPVLQLSITASGRFTGPTVTLPLVTGPVTGSLWVKVPAGSQLQSLELVLSDETAKNQAPINLAVTGWQRVSVSTFVPDSFTRPMSMQLVGATSGAAATPVLTQCWQLEPGLSVTSYIPSSHQVGIREADDEVVLPVQQPGPSIDQDSLNEAIRRVIPAGSTAWTTIVV